MTWEEGWSQPQLQGLAPPSIQQQPPRNPGNSIQAANSSSVTVNGQKKRESGHDTSDGHASGSGTRVNANGHASGSGTRVNANGHTGPRDGQTNASTIVEATNGHSGSGQNTATGIVETTHGQKGSGTSHGESAFVHETVNDPWSESETYHATVNGHSNALHENLDLAREINMKSVRVSGP